MYSKIGLNGDEAAFADYRIKVHAMKNTAAMCGALQVSSLARVLEFAARDLDKTTLEAVMPVFEREWVRLKELFDAAYSDGSEADGAGENGSSNDKPEMDRELFVQYLDTLNSAMEELDTDTADPIIEEFANFSFKPEEQELIDELAVAVKNLDSDAASDLIEKLKR